MTIPSTISVKANSIRNSITGKDVREALASGIEEAGSIADSATTIANDTSSRQDALEEKYNSQLIGSSKVTEVIDAHVSLINGKTYDTIGKRFDDAEATLALKSDQIDLDNVKTKKSSLVRNSDFVNLPFISSRSSVYAFTPNISSPKHDDAKSLKVVMTGYETSSDPNKDFAIILTEQLLPTETLSISFWVYPNASNKQMSIRMAYMSGTVVNLGPANQWTKIELELNLSTMTTNNNWLYFDMMSSYTLYMSDLNVVSKNTTPDIVADTLPISLAEVHQKLTEHAAAVQNSPGLVERMIQVGLTYQDNIGSLVYGNNYTAYDKTVQLVNGKYQVDCSSFANLILHGVPYANSRYAGNATNVESNLFFKNINGYKYRYANQIAKYAFDRGYAFLPKSDFSNIQPGDVLFFSWTNYGGTTDLAQDVRDNSFMKIDHVGIYLHRNNDQYHSTLQLDNGFTTVFYQANQTYMSQCVLVARFPLPNLEPMYPLDNLVIEGDTPRSAVNTTGVYTYKLTKPLVKGRYYTFIINGHVDTSQCYFVVQTGGTYKTLYTDFGRSDGYSGIVTCRFSYDSDEIIDSIAIGIGAPSGTTTNRNATVNWCSLYEGYARNKTEYSKSLQIATPIDFPLDSLLVPDLNSSMAPYYKYAKEGNKVFINLNLPFNTLRTGTLTLGTISGLVSTTQRLPCNLLGSTNQAINAILQISSSGTISIIPYDSSVQWKNAMANGIVFKN